jgi:hypothetical protein
MYTKLLSQNFRFKELQENYKNFSSGQASQNQTVGGSNE